MTNQFRFRIIAALGILIAAGGCAETPTMDPSFGVGSAGGNRSDSTATATAAPSQASCQATQSCVGVQSGYLEGGGRAAN